MEHNVPSRGSSLSCTSGRKKVLQVMVQQRGLRYKKEGCIYRIQCKIWPYALGGELCWHAVAVTSCPIRHGPDCGEKLMVKGEQNTP